MTAAEVFAGERAWSVETGDSFRWLRRLPAGSVRCCVTSPPYYGLRDYGTGTWEGGDPNCDHKPPGLGTRHRAQGKTSTINGKRHVEEGRSDSLRDGSGGRSRPAGKLQGGMGTVDQGTVVRSVCPKCGACRIKDVQVGLEETLEEYVQSLVLLFRRVRNVLANDGTLWLNLGDSYNADGRRTNGTPNGKHRAEVGDRAGIRASSNFLKPKDLMGVPWRVAFALQDDGWYLRSDIIWYAPNKMPESVKDRPTNAHEYLFLLAKSEQYYYDADAVRERAVSTGGGASFGKQKHDAGGTGQQSRTYDRPEYEWKNRRSVWDIPTKSFHGAHFAVMPKALVVPCIRAGSARGDVVLDPFVGSGTVLRAAVEEGRRGIGNDLNPEYAEIARKRVGGASTSLF
jgi:DNA modification methylase